MYHLPGLLRLRGVKGFTLRGKSGDRTKVVLDGERAKVRELVWFESCRDVTVADLTVQNALVHGFTVKGESDVQGARIYNCRIRNFWERGIKGTAPYSKEEEKKKKKMAVAPDEAVLKVRPSGGRIEHCLLENEHPKEMNDWTGGDYVGGIDMMWLKDWVVSDNVFLGIQGKNRQGRGAIFIWNNSEDVVVERNLVVGCDTGIAFGNPSGADRHMTRGVMRHNAIVRGNYKAIEVTRAADSKIHNNTVYSEDADWGRTFHVFDSRGGLEVFNNLVRGQLLVEDPSAKVERNVSGPLPDFFLDPRKGDLRLSAQGRKGARGSGADLEAVIRSAPQGGAR